MADRADSKHAAAAAAEDDWLEGLEDIGEDADAGETVAAAPPPVVGRRPKKRAADSAKPSRRKSRFRDEDGEFPIVVHWGLMVVTGLAGGLVGMLIWAGAMYLTSRSLGFIAILVGVLAGTAVRVGASKWDYGWGPALTATAVTLLALVIGKGLCVHLILRDVVHEMREYAERVEQLTPEMMTHEDLLIADVAGEVAFEWESSGRAVAWADDDFDDYEDFDEFDPEKIRKMYSDDVWQEAAARWERMPDDEKETRREQRRQFGEEMRREVQELKANLDGSPLRRVPLVGFHPLFHPFDVLWFLLACSAAFKIAAGWTDDD